MKIAGITRIRNEEAIIQETLDHFGSFCDAIYVYDDCSTDRTVEICTKHPKVKGIVQGKIWDEDRKRAEWQTRQAVLELAKKDNPEWIIYFDADERIDWNFEGYEQYDGVVMKLFDYYITDMDAYGKYTEREMLGCEYREILMMFKNTPEVKYHMPDQRMATLKNDAQLLHSGYVKHYGKAISIEEWEKTCEYYANHFPEPYKSKWEARKGKAIHTMSDFGRPLIRWHEKEAKGILLTE